MVIWVEVVRLEFICSLKSISLFVGFSGLYCHFIFGVAPIKELISEFFHIEKGLYLSLLSFALIYLNFWCLIDWLKLILRLRNNLNRVDADSIPLHLLFTPT